MIQSEQAAVAIENLDGGESPLKFSGVTKSYRRGQRTVDALKELDFHIASGKITGLIGPDGAGKTTLMRLAAGLLVADRGIVQTLGLDASSQSLQVQASIGYMPQRFGLYEDLTVQENLSLYADLQGVRTESRIARYDELMHMTGLAPFTDRLAGKLSGGMKQKLGLACTLIHPPKLLLLDEPTVGVDPVSRRQLWTIVNRFVEDEGTTVLLSTAYLDEAERCHEVIMLDEGQLVRQGPPRQFSEPLQGRTYQVQVTGRKNRAVQELLTGQPGVTDTVIQGDAVRLVLQRGVKASVEDLLPDEENVVIRSVPPRFEDGFIATLRDRRSNSLKSSGLPSDSKPSSSKMGETETKSRGTKSRGTQQGDSDTARHAIEIHDVERRFGDFYAVKRVSFDVSRGEVFGLLGANGAGKTTLFRMLCGLLPASEGTLQVAGVDVRKTAAKARARIGYMSQKFSLYGSISVSDNLRFFSSAYGLTGRQRRDRMAWATDEFELGPVANDESGGLPLGYKQRLALACALMHEPEIIFLDEPTSGVDPLARREFWHRINVLAASGVTVLITTHFMEEAEYCDRMAIMMAGEILALGTPAEIKDHSRTDRHPEPTMEDAFIGLIERREQS